jgi:DNA-3-methyladenine glycosylase
MSEQIVIKKVSNEKKLSKRKLNINNSLKLNDEKRWKCDKSEENVIWGEMCSHYFLNNKISSNFLVNKTCIESAKALLGQILCRRLSPNGPILKARIVETESYLGVEDMASHSYKRRRTKRNEPMFMKCGTCYVYFTYGMYYCFNISTKGEGEAVLVRAVQPLEGIDFMQQLRAKARKTNNESNICKTFKLKELSNGPSKLCMAFDININNINKVDIFNSDHIWLESGINVCPNDIVITKRVGISRAGEWNDKPLRFYIKDCEFVSQK